ncbi:MAG: hypothetical protein A3H92_07990 [Rhodospirillales bacterium RIFCSPLOWO2_02_FULL_58_16]|nr:MAG: hypothetical protein A3H92_07990 [Rhodospirillales bacterium RIFCSPLOWO2_02_FULL_58_16]
MNAPVVVQGQTQLMPLPGGAAPARLAAGLVPNRQLMMPAGDDAVLGQAGTERRPGAERLLPQAFAAINVPGFQRLVAG